MKYFQVYKHPFYGFECVKIGFSWPALFFGIIWMLFSRLWLTSIIWLIVYALTTYIVSNRIANLPISLVAIAIYISLWLLPAFQGNNWRASKHLDRGFDFLNVVQAASKEHAISIALSDLNAVENTQGVQTSQLGGNLLFEKNFSQSNSFGAMFAFILIVAGLITSLITTKPNDAAFMSYLLNGKRIQADVAARIEPGDTLTAMALLEDIFSIAAAGNFEQLAPIVQKKDYLLFVLYSAETKTNNKTPNRLSTFKKIDAAQAMGFNCTYIGVWGSFFRLKNEPLQNGLPVNVYGESPITKNSKTEPIVINHKKDAAITFKQAVSMLEALPEIAKQIDEDTEDVLALIPGNDNDSYEKINGRNYISVNLIENHEDHAVTRQRYFVSLDGQEVLLWDIEDDEYQRVNLSKVNQFNPNRNKHSNKASIDKDIQSNVQSLGDSLSINQEAIINNENEELASLATEINNPAPEYPKLSKRQGEQGLVILKVLVSDIGLPESIDVEKTSGFERLDQAAIHAVQQWKFKPAQKDKKTISSYIKIPITFTLK